MPVSFHLLLKPIYCEGDFVVKVEILEKYSNLVVLQSKCLFIQHTGI